MINYSDARVALMDEWGYIYGRLSCRLSRKILGEGNGLSSGMKRLYRQPL